MRVDYFQWVDSVSTDGWGKIDEIKGVSTCVSLGFLIKEDDECVLIAASESPSTEQYSGLMCIPKCAIKMRKSFEMTDDYQIMEHSPNEV